MLRFSDSRNFGRTLGAIGLIVGPCLMAIGSLISPAWGDDTAEYLGEVAGSEGAHVVSGVFFLFAGFLLMAGMIGLLRLMRGRGVTLGQVAASLILIGVFASSGFYVISVIEAEAVGAGRDRAEMVALLEGAQNSAGAAVMFVLFLGGIVLGSLLLALAIWRSKVAPIWSPLALVGATAMNFLSGSSIVGALGFVLLAIGLAGPALAMLKLSDERWAAWTPLAEEQPAAVDRRPPARRRRRGPRLGTRV